MKWPNARLIERPSGTWEMLGDDAPCARDDGGAWYWVALQRRGAPAIYSGAVRLPPRSADVDELAPQLEQVVRRALKLRRSSGRAQDSRQPSVEANKQ